MSKASCPPLRRAVTLMLTLVGVASVSGCVLDGKEFRSTAGPSLEAGMTALATGLIDGAFAAYMPDDDEGATTNDQTTSGG